MTATEVLLAGLLIESGLIGYHLARIANALEKRGK